MEFSRPLSHLVGIGPTIAKRLELLGLFTVEDLVHHYPFRYDDFSKSTQLNEVKVGEVVTLTGEIWSIKNVYTRSRKTLTQAIFNDGTSSLELVWFNQSWLAKNLPAGSRVQISGKVSRKGSKLSILQPTWEKLAGVLLHTGRLVPIYPETFGINSKWLRQKINYLFPLIESEIIDPLSSHLSADFLDLTSALQQIHFPDNFATLNKAKKRLSFDELFDIQLATQYQRLTWQKKTVVNPWKIFGKKLTEFIHNLPFQLTNAQQRVIKEIVEDLQKSTPMNRLVQGEVGSGKTVVAAVIIYLAHLNGFKTLLMTPTEILAFQHYATLSKLLKPLGINVTIYTGSKKEREGDIVVGTHALLSDKLQADNIGLVIVDEQQRFGVEQRTKLRNRSSSPHFLTMTATPIPRTVALTLYGDLDLSIIDELPKGRKIVQTHFVPSKKRLDAYKFIADHLKVGEQVYVVTPLIEASETNQSAKAVKVEFEKLKKILPQFNLGLLHGKLKSADKQQALDNFKSKKTHLLVSTSVVEVGVDVPNATIMVIEGSERFGLAQLHQLRGRVGRAGIQSFCLLFTESEEPQLVSRIKNLETIHDGLKLAEIDLQIRGSGEIYGIRQSGRWNLKIADLSDKELAEQSKILAVKILAESPNLDKYPQLKAKLSSGLLIIAQD